MPQLHNVNNMKKRILISIGLIICLTLNTGVKTAYAETAEEARPFSAKRVFSKVAESLGLTDWVEEAFTSEKNVGKNTYFKIYEEIRSKVEDKTARRVADSLGVTASEVKDFLGGDIAAVLDYMEEDCRQTTPDDSLCKIDKSEALMFIQNLQGFVDETRMEEKLLANTEEQLFATEVYANGSTADSGFDLLTDLDIIDKFLFQKETITYPVPVVGSEHELSLSDLLGDRDGKTESREEKVESRGEEAAAGGAQNEERDREEDMPGGGSEPVNEPATEEETGPRECFTDNKLEESLTQYENEIGTIEQGLTLDDGSGTIRTGPDAEPTRPQDRTHLGDNIIPAPAAIRIGDQICPVTDEEGMLKTQVCFEVNTKWRQPTLYHRVDNCITCHIEHINTLFKETLSHSLVPGKITGNLYEPAKCKKGFGQVKLDFNFFMIFNPIITPPNDNLLFKPSAFATWKKLQEMYPYNFISKLIPDGETPQETVESHANDWALSVARDETPKTEVMKKIDEIVSQEQDNLTFRLANLDTVTLAQAENSNTKALEQEMQVMLQLFESFKAMFEEIVKEPCEELPKKSNTE